MKLSIGSPLTANGWMWVVAEDHCLLARSANESGALLPCLNSYTCPWAIRNCPGKEKKIKKKEEKIKERRLRRRRRRNEEERKKKKERRRKEEEEMKKKGRRRKGEEREKKGRRKEEEEKGRLKKKQRVRCTVLHNLRLVFFFDLFFFFFAVVVARGNLACDQVGSRRVDGQAEVRLAIRGRRRLPALLQRNREIGPLETKKGKRKRGGK
jgi:hypothetical protein